MYTSEHIVTQKIINNLGVLFGVQRSYAFSGRQFTQFSFERSD